MQQGVFGMRRLRKAPSDSKIRSKPNDEHALPALRHAIVGGVEQFRDNVVLGGAVTGGVMFLQSTPVFTPGFLVPSDEAWIGQLQADIFKIGCERFALESLDIFKDERFR